MQVPLSKPDITDLERRYVLETLSSDQLSFGPKLHRFEQLTAAVARKKYAVAMNSGTSALHIAVRALGIKAGDEVITTPYSFIASSNCLLFEKVTPVLVDIDAKTLNMDVDRIEQAISSRTKAILPVHIYGQPTNMSTIQQLADHYDLAIIEDACEAIGARWNNQFAGSFGDVSVFSFYPNKQVTTGEGGVFLTDDESLYELAMSMRNQGRSPKGTWLEHAMLGYNYRMSDLQAAVGVAQLERLDEILTKRADAAERYKRLLHEYNVNVTLPTIDSRAHISWFVFIVVLPRKVNREHVMTQLAMKGVQTRPYFPSIHLQSFYQDQFDFKAGDLPVSEQLSARTMAIPFFSEITIEQQRYVIQQLAMVMKEQN